MKKKNLFGWLAMAAMLVGTGCSTDEVVNNYSEDNAIEFGTYVGRNAVSRATVIDNQKLGTDGFGVFAYYTGQTAWTSYTTKTTPNFMNNEDVKGTTTNNVTTWSYSPLKYWPNNVDDKVSFFAYAPYTAVNTNATTNVTGFNGTFSQTTGTTNPVGPYVSFTVADDVKTQQDLLWTTPHIDMVKNASTTNTTGGVTVEEKIKFIFEHALARIGFKVQAMVDKVNEDDGDATDGTIESDDATDQSGTIATNETTIEVKKVTLSGDFYKSGVLNLNPTITGTGDSRNVANLWSNQTAYESGWSGYILTSTEADATAGTEASTNFKRSTKTEGETSQEVKHEIVTTTETELNAEDSYIMVIPKDFPSNGSDDKIKIEVVYTVTTTDSNLTSSDSKSVVTNTITSEFNGINFEAGKAYTFCLHLGMTSVKLEAEVKDWATATEWSVNVPLNTTSTTTGGTTQP